MFGIDNSATAKLLHRAIQQYGRHQPTIKEQFVMAAITGLLAGSPTLTNAQVLQRAVQIATLATDGRQRGDTDG